MISNRYIGETLDSLFAYIQDSRVASIKLATIWKIDINLKRIISVTFFLIMYTHFHVFFFNYSMKYSLSLLFHELFKRSHSKSMTRKLIRKNMQ